MKGWVAIASLAVGAILPRTTLAQELPKEPEYTAAEQVFPGPRCAAVPTSLDNLPGRRPTLCDAAERDGYWQALEAGRAELRPYWAARNDYDMPGLRWTQSDFVQTLMMAHDRFFFDTAQGRYTVDRFLADLTERYGGIDSVLIWCTYPNLGIDDRNQFDFFQGLPGGVNALRQAVADFHRRGVHVLFPLMPWDAGTRAQNTSFEHSLVAELVAVDADGINGDTLAGLPLSYRNESQQQSHPLALEPELGVGPDEALAWNTLSWGYWTYGFVPSVDKFKWYEPRHLTHLSRRSARDHTDDLQEAFFNGIGFVSWENIWGEWNALSPRDAAVLRRLATIQRALAPNLISNRWLPHAPTEQFGVFASRWPLPQRTLWTIVNRNAYEVTGVELRVSKTAGRHYFDLWHGVELHPREQGNERLLEFSLEAKGFGAVVETGDSDETVGVLLKSLAAAPMPPLQTLAAGNEPLHQTVASIAPAFNARADSGPMVKIPAAAFHFQVNGVEIEGDNRLGVDVEYPWESTPHRYHDHWIDIPAFWMDKYPVTNAQFAKFLEGTHYRPRDPYNFLKDWTDGRYPKGWDHKPVTWVSLEDARAYASWAGKRLPNEWEWQYAAQGTDARPYPWGSQWDSGAAPEPDRGRIMQAAADVESHPKGASPFGVMDLVGNVWQWTNEFTDEHTRSAVLRGGSHYQPQGSDWYFPQAYRLSQHGKYLLMAPSMDRSGAIGFRCAADVTPAGKPARFQVAPPLAPQSTHWHGRRAFGPGCAGTLPAW